MTVDPKIVFRTPWFQIGVVEPGAEPSGTKDPYYCLLRGAGVLTCIFDVEGRVVLVEQYRPPLGRTTLEMPAGTIDPGESPEQAAIRETFEETGFVCERWFHIAPFRLMLNREDVADHFFVGLAAHKPPASQAAEKGTVRLIPRPEFLAMVRSGQFEQTAALGGVYLADTIFSIDLFRMNLADIAARLEAGCQDR